MKYLILPLVALSLMGATAYHRPKTHTHEGFANPKYGSRDCAYKKWDKHKKGPDLLQVYTSLGHCPVWVYYTDDDNIKSSQGDRLKKK